MAKNDKTPLTSSSINSNEKDKSVDYEAIFRRNSHYRQNTKFAQETVLGECRNPRRLSWVEWVFLVVASLSLMGVLGVTVERLVYFQNDFVNLSNDSLQYLEPNNCHTWVCTNDFIFAVLILVNIGFCAFYCFDGLFRERPFEILAYVAAALVIIVYIIINFIVKGSEDQPSRIVRLALVCVFGPVNITLALWSWCKMGYLVLNVIGSNKHLIYAYRIRSLFLTLQIFHLELLSSVFVLAWAMQGQLLETWEKVILGLLLPHIFIVALLGAIAILWELRVFVYIWYALVVPCGVYYLYKVIEVGIHFHDEYDSLFDEDSRGGNGTIEMNVVDLKYIGAVLLLAWWSVMLMTILSGIVGFLMVIALVVFMSLSLVNFGKGLKEKIHPPLHKWMSRQ